jgi:hypothetical protein
VIKVLKIVKKGRSVNMRLSNSWKRSGKC